MVCMTDAQLIEKLGGSAKLARRLGYEGERGTARVNNWKTRGIPARVRLDHQAVFQAALQDKRKGERRAA